MNRASLLILLAATLTTTGCNLAKDNPCGGFYPADGFADVSGADLGGNMTVKDEYGAHAYTFASGPVEDDDCETFVSGREPDDGTGTTNVQVECAQTSVAFTLPDVRTIAIGTQISTAAVVTVEDGTTIDSTISVTFDRATGSKEPSPTFVSSDFLRGATIAFDSRNVPLDAGADAGNDFDGGESAVVTLNGTITFDASNFTQAENATPDNCPAVPAAK